MRWTGLSVAIVMALVVAGCGLIPSSPPPVDPGMLDLHASNQTTLPVTISVNGQVVGVAEAGRELTSPSATLPSMPWSVEARSPTGRLLTSMAVRRENISSERQADGSTWMSGAGARIDLSCGRLDLWVGVPMLGPAPGPGSPGDCAP
jgi:hypothetical protein